MKNGIEIVNRSDVTGEPHTLPTPPYILVVDDERLIADSLVEILHTEGYGASAAYDARSALDAAELFPPDLVISDVMMPGMTGVDLAIVLWNTIPDCKILLFSGQAMSSDLLQEARSEGYDFHVISKPIHPTDLLREIATIDAPASHPPRCRGDRTASPRSSDRTVGNMNSMSKESLGSRP